MKTILQAILALCLANVFVVAVSQKEATVTASNGIDSRAG